LTETDLQIDGEYAGRQTARLEIDPGALTMLVPPNYG
jgi:diacylglycerol kinase family enzyme